MAKEKQKYSPVDRIIAALGYMAKIKDFSIVFVLIIILAVFIVPLPSYLLDLFLTLSFAIATLIILMAIYVPKPTDFTTFPTLILVITLYRLSLNVGTTKMILSKGHNGPEAVSDIIASFGQFVVGGNYVIGIIVFSILVIINFLVITNGSTRVAEVGARFTLDAMPGKQMAIDADLNAGSISEEEAKKRRQEILTEANFYGAMDGSSKFVKGDAIAGIIITLINIIGGILIGTFQHGMSIADSASTFTILTIGDGLVGQIPALLMSTATGIIITRASKESGNLARGIIEQLGADYKLLIIVGIIMLLFAAIPGLPTISLGLIGFIFIGVGLLIEGNINDKLKDWFLKQFKISTKEQTAQGAKIAKGSMRKQTKTSELSKTKKPEKSPEELEAEEEKALEGILKVELLELDLGYGLIKLADKSVGGDLLERIKAMRRKVAGELGFLMPKVRIRDNLQLQPDQYEIKLKGISVGGGNIKADKIMAMTSGLTIGEIEGEATKEPAFGLDAIWISPEIKEDAIIKGYTIVDPSTVLTTHLSEMVKQHAEELLTREAVKNLTDALKKEYPTVIEDAMSQTNLGMVQQVLKSLLHEKVPIKDMLTIMETIADTAAVTKNIPMIVERVRAGLARAITKMYQDNNGVIKLMTLDNTTEQKLLEKLNEQNGLMNLVLSIGEIQALVDKVSENAREITEMGVVPVVLIADPLLRKPLAEIFERFSIEVVVLSHAEISASAKFEALRSVQLTLS